MEKTKLDRPEDKSTSKKAKITEPEVVADSSIPSSIIVNFLNSDNLRAGPPVDLPVE